MSNPLVSIIIINWNGGNVLNDCLKSLSKIKYSNYKIILVDNGSKDGSQKLPYQFKLIQNKTNLGFAKANNQGLALAKGKYILLLNNDTKVDPNFLTRLVDRTEQDEQIGVIQPKIFLMAKKGFLDNAGSFLTRIGFLTHWGFNKKDNREFSKEREIFSAKGACMLIRRSVIDKVGLFDNDFFAYFEESDFCWRVWMEGYTILFYPEAKIYHKLGFTIRRLGATELNYHYYKNRICSLVKNLETKNLFLILVPHLIISTALLTLFILRLQFKYASMIARAFWWNIRNLPGTLKKRKIVQKQRKVSDDMLFPNVLATIDWRKFFSDYKRVEEDLKRIKG